MIQHLMQHASGLKLHRSRTSFAEWVDASETGEQDRSANVIASVMAGAEGASSPAKQAIGVEGAAKIDVLRCGTL